MSLQWILFSDKNRRIAKQKGIRLDPYNLSDVQQFTADDLQRIRDSVDSFEKGHWDEKEYAYFESDSIVRLIIDNKKIIPRQSFETLTNTEKLVVLRQGQLRGFRESEESIKSCYVWTWQQAVERGCLDSYMAGVGVFKDDVRSAGMVYSGDYDSYIKSLSAAEYMMLLFRKRTKAEPENFDDSRSFVDVGLSHVAIYTEIIKQVDETKSIFLVGDGIGVGSYVCRLLNRTYGSSEPYDIGREARTIGLINCDEGDVDKYDVVFLGNVVNYLSLEQFRKFSQRDNVIMWDERPLGIENFSSGGDYRLWWRGTHVFIPDSGRYKYLPYLRRKMNKSKFKGIDQVSQAIIVSSGLHKSVGTTLYVGVDYATIAKMPMRNVYHIPTNSFVNSAQARDGQLKRFKEDLIEWYESRYYLLETSYGPIEYEGYVSTTLTGVQLYDVDVYRCLEVKSPARIKYAVYVDRKVRVIYLYTDKDKWSYYQSTSSYCYTSTLK